MQIKHFKHKAIDIERWDKLISNSESQLGYAYSWYLDIVSPGWEALIANDYEYVMPLPVKRKYGIPYLVQPIMTQQLGIFSNSKISEEIIQKFIKQIPYYSYEINLNENNFKADIVEQPNYVLNLNYNYNTLLSNYSKNSIRNIEKAKKNALEIIHDIEIDNFVAFYNSIEKNFNATNDTLLKKLLLVGSQKNALRLSGIVNEHKELIAAVCLFFTGNRIVYLLPVSNKEGKKKSAMFLFIDSLIKEHANSRKLLDFEGSRIEGIARFYKGFGALNQPYFILKRLRPAFLIGI